MATFLIDPRGNGGDQFTVDAADFGEAAQVAAAKIFPRFTGGHAIRATGESDSGGMFKVWRTLRGSTVESDHGSAFHVMRLRD